MSSIHILSEKVANQIAAGEVVERPASVVKELVENSLDAAASRVEVHVEGDGTRLLRIIDDGVGMDQDDVLLCLERHATSKLSGEEDLAAIRTLGFRGEAIPSIASVSQLIITSRPKGAVLGSRVEIRHGTVAKVHDMGCAEGTMMEVKNLFGNVPARRKFLKSTRTELAHIEEAIVNCALANSAVAFRLTFDSRMVCDVPTAPVPAVRVRTVLGLAVDTELIEITGSQAGVELAGYLLPPGFVATSGLRLFVNNRPVRDRMLAHAVFEGFQGFLLKGSRPAGVFFVSLPAGEVDVNVHPTKQEVRFRQPAVLHRLVVDTVQTAVGCFQERAGKRLMSSADRSAADTDHRYESVPPAAVVVALAEEAPRFVEPAPAPKCEEGISLLPTFPAEKKQQRTVFSPDRAAMVAAAPGPVPMEPVVLSRVENSSPEGAVSQRALHDEAAPVSFRLIGQALNSFILLEDGESLLVIDQHAAQERLLYEKLRQQVLDGGMVRQSLLFPVVLELNAVQEQVVEQFHDDIARMGLELAEFGGSSYRLSAVPALLGHLAPQMLLDEVLEGFSFEGRRGSGRDYVQQILASMACKAAIKANHHLNEAEMTALVNEMRAARIFSHCPHGRPVVRTFSRQQVGRWFDRT